MFESFFWRLEVLVVMWGGLLLSLLSEAYRRDIETEDRLTFRVWLWDGAQKWKVLGSNLIIFELSFILPHEALMRVMNMVAYDLPLGYVGVMAMGFLADDVFFMLDAVARKFIKGKIPNGHTK